MDGRFAGYYQDQLWRQKPLNAPTNHHTLTNHDFFISRRAFFFDLSPWPDEATDDMSQPVGTDYRTLCEMLQTAHTLRRGSVPCYIGGFPEWAYKYTQKVGGKHKDVATEWQFAELISRYMAFKDADAIGYGALANASFWQHFPLRKRYSQPWTTRKKLKKAGYLNEDADGNMQLEPVGKSFQTSDLGYLDAEGRLFLTGRSSEFINIGGLKLSPVEVEDAAMGFTGILDCLCIPVSHPVMGQVPKLLVVLQEGFSLNKKEIARYLKEKLTETWKVPINYEVVEEIRKMPNGKKNRKSYIM
jgi:acyl-CoA synthetase (AMP-forming)/AMP-acid ligase II